MVDPLSFLEGHPTLSSQLQAPARRSLPGAILWDGGASVRQPPNGSRLSCGREARRDRKSTRLNSSHRCISYAVFCLKKKKKIKTYEKYRKRDLLQCWVNTLGIKI